jgi:hypothetical protein
MIGQGLAVISVLGIVGWWMGGVDLPEFLSGDWGSGRYRLGPPKPC